MTFFQISLADESPQKTGDSRLAAASTELSLDEQLSNQRVNTENKAAPQVTGANGMRASQSVSQAGIHSNRRSRV